MDNDKLIIIHEDGTIEHIGNFHDEEEYHSVCLLNYAKEKYPNVTIFDRLNYRHKAETIAYFYTLIGDIVIINDSDNKLKYGRTGWVLMPSEITDIQYNKLYELVPVLKDYNVKLTYDMNMDTGILAGHTIYDNDHNFEGILDNYFETIDKKKSTR